MPFSAKDKAVLGLKILNVLVASKPGYQDTKSVICGLFVVNLRKCEVC